MPEFKERPKSGRQKAARPGTALPKQAVRQIKEKYIKELKEYRKNHRIQAAALRIRWNGPGGGR